MSLQEKHQKPNPWIDSLQEKHQKPNPWIDLQKAQNRPQTDPKSSFLVPHSGSLAALGSQVSTDGEFWSSKLPNGPRKASRNGVQTRPFFGTNFEARILSHSGSKRGPKLNPKVSLLGIVGCCEFIIHTIKISHFEPPNWYQYSTTFLGPL